MLRLPIPAQRNVQLRNALLPNGPVPVVLLLNELPPSVPARGVPQQTVLQLNAPRLNVLAQVGQPLSGPRRNELRQNALLLDHANVAIRVRAIRAARCGQRFLT